MSDRIETATFGGGCFWCVEAVFQQVRGVESVVSGYCGGKTHNPTYDDVCSGTTGHAEVVQVAFDQTVVSYRDILCVFFGIHDPTTRNRQGEDFGTQYRSVILFHNDGQKQAAEELIAHLTKEKIWSAPIVTELAPYATFFPAEKYHQEYLQKNPTQPYCQAVVEPKHPQTHPTHASLLKG